MISVRHRFHGYGSVRGVYKHGQSVRGRTIGLKFASRAATKPYRAAVVVSRKVHKSAVVRNKIRRRIYERIRTLNIEPGTDLVFTVFDHKVAGMPASELDAAISDLMRKATQAK